MSISAKRGEIIAKAEQFELVEDYKVISIWVSSKTDYTVITKPGTYLK